MDLALLDATAQAELVRSNQVTPAELVDAAIERVERLNPQINAVVIPLFEKAGAQARSAELPDGPFRGVPILVKDSVASGGDPMYLSMRLLRDLQWTEKRDSYVVSKLRTAGFVIVGRTNLPELEAGITTEPIAYGPTRNPWDLTRSVGGSSGGSAAAVAAGMTPLALGVDSGGSIRIPSSMCGVVGLKPSRGRVSPWPRFAEEGYSIAHAITRSVRDSAAVLDVLAGQTPGDQFVAPPPPRPFATEVGAEPGRLRVGMWTPSGLLANVHADCIAASENAAKILEGLGHDVEAAHPAALEEGLIPDFFTFAVSYIAWQIHFWAEATGREIGPDDLEPVTWAAVEAGRQVTAVAYEESLRKVREFAQRFASWWNDGFDLLLTPTIAVPPFPLGATSAPSPGEPWPDVQPWIPFSPQFNITGQPAITLPLHWNDEGLPIGVQLGAANGREDILIRTASQMEQANPWDAQTPPLHA